METPVLTVKGRKIAAFLAMARRDLCRVTFATTRRFGVCGLTQKLPFSRFVRQTGVTEDTL